MIDKIIVNNTEMIDYLSNPEILNLGEIIRYNNRPKIRKENVAEHSFYVVTNVIKICAMLGINGQVKCDAIEFAAVHDIPEAFLGDVPYTTKRDNPMLSEILEKAELHELEKRMPEFYSAYKDYVDGEKTGNIASLIVKLADTISVVQYSNNEIQLGNTSDAMVAINNDSISRAMKMLQRIMKLEEEKQDENSNTKVW